MFVHHARIGHFTPLSLPLLAPPLYAGSPAFFLAVLPPGNMAFLVVFHNELSSGLMVPAVGGMDSSSVSIKTTLIAFFTHTSSDMRALYLRPPVTQWETAATGGIEAAMVGGVDVGMVRGIMVKRLHAVVVVIWPKAQCCIAAIKIPKKGVELQRKGKTGAGSTTIEVGNQI
ncbi:hypothetical protein K438DRAFT_1780819 [Mycena galopus ATCC 62051]|nr:hypothetical protein K438DRAFT_1780819 [Mycena galopus ATCC 62051]